MFSEKTDEKESFFQINSLIETNMQNYETR